MTSILSGVYLQPLPVALSRRTSLFVSMLATNRNATRNLSGNPLSTLPSGIFDELKQLEQLYIGWMSLPSLPSGIFDELENLTVL